MGGQIVTEGGNPVLQVLAPRANQHSGAVTGFVPINTMVPPSIRALFSEVSMVSFCDFICAGDLIDCAHCI